MSRQARTIWTFLIMGVLVTSVGYLLLRPAPEQPKVDEVMQIEDELHFSAEVWKEADAVYFCQITGSATERYDVWQRASRNVHDGGHRDGLAMVHWITTSYNEKSRYMYFMIGFRIPPEKRWELPQFLSPDPSTKMGGRISGCGWIKAR